MNELERNPADWNAEAAASASEQRKPYSKPSFRFEPVFETLALLCGKIAGTSAACNSVKIAS